MANYLIFGDLHGRILPAFRLAAAYAREHDVRLDGLLQVGDLGYFPDTGRLDRATLRHAARDPLELGAALIASPSEEADQLFATCGAVLPDLWFTAGNHEDFEELAAMESLADPSAPAFPVDAYTRVQCIRDGEVAELPGGLRVGALWGIDDEAPGARRSAVGRAVLLRRSVTRLSGQRLDVLLSHDGPLDTVVPRSGSQALRGLLQEARPAFSFFGHYGQKGSARPWAGPTRLYHLGGFELRQHAEPGSVGLLRWRRGAGDFRYLDPAWLRTFARHGWEHR
jgi:hypothetical protein